METEFVVDVDDVQGLTNNSNIPRISTLVADAIGATVAGGPSSVTAGPRARGPLASLETNKYAVAETLKYPIDITDETKYKHYIKFSINIPEKSEYSKTLGLTGGLSTADANRAQTNQLGGAGELGFVSSALTGAGASVFGSAVGALTALAENKDNVLGAIGGAALGALKGPVVGTALGIVDVKRKTKRLKQQIYLYIPDTVQMRATNEYDAVSLTDALGMAGFAAQGLQSVGGSVSDAAKSGASIFTGGGNVTNPPTGTGAATTELLGKLATATGAFGSGIEQVILNSRGYVQNPQIEIIFKSVKNREFQFEFKFTPKSQREAVEAINIIKAFRFHAAPELVGLGTNAPPEDLSAGGGRYFIPPSEFDIEYMFGNDGNKSLHKISSCVLTNIDVNYVSAGQWTTFDDGIPVEIAVILNFQEVEIIHKKLVEEGY